MDYLIRTPAQLSAILKSARKQKGLTQAAAGETVGLKQSTVSVIEKHVGGTAVETLYKLLSALDLELVVRDKKADPEKASSSTSREW